MLRLFKPPETNYANEYDVTRFNLVWNISIAVILMLSLVSLINLRHANYTSLFNLLEVGVGIISLIILYKTRKYEAASILYAVGSLLLVTIAFFTLNEALHYTTPMWGTINVLFTFFILGRYWGLGVLFVHFITLVFYYTLRLESNLANLPPIDDSIRWGFILETLIVGLVTAYLLLSYSRATKIAESKVRKTNEELVEQNKIITAQNKEKEIMLKEIHHRVKNNLQVITSLLRLQAQDMEPKERASFQDAINRIKSMALIHEKMYKSDVLAEFNLKSYLESLTHDLIGSYSQATQIELKVNSVVELVGSKSIVPLSLLFNELISNSIKHAFNEGGQGRIEVFVSEPNEENFIELVYRDNGTWKDTNQKTFGLELIGTMTAQLEGSFNLNKEPGQTTYRFSLNAMME